MIIVHVNITSDNIECIDNLSVQTEIIMTHFIQDLKLKIDIMTRICDEQITLSLIHRENCKLYDTYVNLVFFLSYLSYYCFLNIVN